MRVGILTILKFHGFKHKQKVWKMEGKAASYERWVFLAILLINYFMLLTLLDV
jgi:hypothetical protein